MTIVTFGEIMGRLGTSNNLRFQQSMPIQLEMTFGGAEANVAASLALLGSDVRYVTALPDTALADACVASLDSFGIDTGHIVRPDAGRLGLYFLESGANQRPSKVIYDRSGSTISLTSPEQYAWDEIFSGAAWLHVSGITPAVSRQAADSTLAAVESARRHGCQVSCDLNFRKMLWRWDDRCSPRELAERTMREILASVDVVIANEEDCEIVLGIKAGDTDVGAGQLSTDRYPQVAEEVIQQFPNVTKVGITLRESVSASHNNWGGMLYAAGKAHFAPLDNGSYCPYAITNIVDRVGAGDAFAAGLIFSLNTHELTAPENAIRFAVAASCLAHSIVGDFNLSSRAEIESLMAGATSGRVVR